MHNRSFTPHTHTKEPPLLSANELLVGYDNIPILPPITFELKRNDFWAIIGRNGSGKSTLLKTLLKIHPKVGGTLSYTNHLRIGYVSQRNDMDKNIPARVIDIVKSGIDRKWSFLNPFTSQSQKDLIEQSMVETSTESLAYLQFSNLSEGQKQRVMLAKALVSNPQILILDEPTSAMDIVAERNVFELIDTLRSSHSMGILLINHHLALVADRATDILYVDKEHQIALSGCIETIAKNPAFIKQYGIMDCSYIVDYSKSDLDIHNENHFSSSNL